MRACVFVKLWQFDIQDLMREFAISALYTEEVVACIRMLR